MPQMTRLTAGPLTSTLLLTTCSFTFGASPRIEEKGVVPIGGIDQWITVRGHHSEDPILLIVHGGPGDAQSHLVEAYAPYERNFVVAQWDQRGSGHTFGRNREAVKEVTLDQLVSDGVEVVSISGVG
jgi:pimeloyl-ACP methyl ester carboxylesterase